MISAKTANTPTAWTSVRKQFQKDSETKQNETKHYQIQTSKLKLCTLQVGMLGTQPSLKSGGYLNKFNVTQKLTLKTFLFQKIQHSPAKCASLPVYSREMRYTWGIGCESAPKPNLPDAMILITKIWSMVSDCHVNPHRKNLNARPHYQTAAGTNNERDLASVGEPSRT